MALRLSPRPHFPLRVIHPTWTTLFASTMHRQSGMGYVLRVQHLSTTGAVRSSFSLFPTKKDPLWKKSAKFCGLFTGSVVLGVFTVVSALFIHDALTYTSKHVDRVPVSPLALHPETGGPRDLPIAKVLMDDEEDEENRKLKDKPKLVILGGGWGSIGVLKSIRPGDYHVTVISPDTFTQFTPLLPSAAVGTVQIRSLVESLRKVIARVHGHYIEAKAIDLVMGEKLVEVEVKVLGEKRNVYIPYDKLIISVGSVSATHGVPGIENCFQLKTIRDAQDIRRRILDNFEAASAPNVAPEERTRLLSFVVCGGGPTGVETAAEIYDLCQEDVMRYFPKIVREQVSIHIIQSRDHILNTYSEEISKYAEKKFQREDVNVIVNSRVKEVAKDRVIYTAKDTATGKMVEKSIPTNFVLWSTGIAMNPFTKRVSDLLPNQVHKRAIEVDAYLRVKGAPLGTVYALGDAATIETSVNDYLLELVDESDKNKDGQIDFDEWQNMVTAIKKKVPMASSHLTELRNLFEQYDANHNNALTLSELQELLANVARKITALPATAQVAAQQGKYIGRKLSVLARQRATLAANDIKDYDDGAYYKAFSYHHLGNLAYIGNAAVFDYRGWSLMGGLSAMYAWRSVYWSEQVSMRTRALLMFDWIVRGVWGRDLSKL